MDDKPLFMDEKEFESLSITQDEKVEPALETKNVDTKVENVHVDEEIKMEVSESIPETKEEETKVDDTPSVKNEIVKSNLEKPVINDSKTTNGKGFVMDSKLFVTILCSIIVAYMFLSVARNLFYGFKYYDQAHGNNNVVEPQK